MPNQSDTPQVDHRHPDLAGITFRILNAVERTTGPTHSRQDLISRACNALRNTDTGDHREVVLAALPPGAAAGYDSELPESRAGSVKAILSQDDSPELEELTLAVVRAEACHHVNLVKKLVSRFVSQQDPTTFSHTAEDLFTYGYIGLTNALKGYDPSCNNTISTFSAFRINGAVRDGIRSESPVPKRLTTFVRKVRAVEEALTVSLSRVPTQSEVRQELGDDARHMHLYPRLYHQASLDEISQSRPLDEDAFFATDDDVSHSVETRQAGNDLRTALSELTTLEQQVVQLVHVDGLTWRKAALECGEPLAAVRSAEESAMRKLREQPQVQKWNHLVAS